MSAISKRATFLISTVCLAMFLWPVVTVAQDAPPEIAQAKSLIAEKQFDKLQPLVGGLEKAAQAGNADAQFLLGEMFASKDTDIFASRRAEAIPYYEKALAAGKIVAAGRLGDIYSNERIVPKDPVKAFQYYSQAASTGKSPYAERRVASAYLLGEGVAADPAKAIAMLQKLADAGDAVSARALGDAYADESFAGADKTLAIKYYEQALKGGNGLSARLLGRVYATMEGPESLVQSFNYFKQAADRGDAFSKRQIAQAYLKGSGVEKDPDLGIRILEDLAATNDKSALSDLAALYASGTEVKRDGGKAIELYSRAADAGDAGAVVRLADLYYFGKVVPRDTAKAISMLSDASDKGNIQASRRLIMLYREAPGKAIAKSPAKAKAVFEKAKPAMTPETALQEEILFAAIDSKSLRDYEEISRKFDALPVKSAKPAFTTVRRLNPNLYVYVIQERLKAAELYRGRLSGMLTPDTIRSVNALCRKGEQADKCGLGPLSPVVAGLIADEIFKVSETASKTN